MRKIFASVALLATITIHFAVALPARAASNSTSFDSYSKYFYNRYSTHFDDFGLAYAVPSYGITDFKSPTTAREWMSLASYYKYRAADGEEKAKNILRDAILKAVDEINSRPAKTQSFNDAEAYFLVIRMIESVPDLITDDEQTAVDNSMRTHIAEGIQAADTENRALVAGAHWQYVLDYLYKKRLISKTEYQQLATRIKTKIDKAIATSITKTGWYKENKFTTFSLHYHAVSAFMLLSYANQTHQPTYDLLAKKMYRNLKSFTNADGSVPQKNIGNRPVGVGAQFYLMVGVLGQRAGDSNYQKFFSYSQGDRFFSDPHHPNRLEYHSNDTKNRQFHDDYAFSDIAELAR